MQDIAGQKPNRDKRDDRTSASPWVSVGAAAAALHMTPDGMRKAFRRGRLQARKLAGRWEISLPSAHQPETFGANGTAVGDETPHPPISVQEEPDDRDSTAQEIPRQTGQQDKQDYPKQRDNQDKRTSSTAKHGTADSASDLEELARLRLEVTHLHTLTDELRLHRAHLETQIADMQQHLTAAEVERGELRRLALAAQSQVQQTLTLLPQTSSSAEQHEALTPPARRRWWWLW